MKLLKTICLIFCLTNVTNVYSKEIDSWSYKDWETTSVSSGYLRSITHGKITRGNEFGIVKSNLSCEQNILWLTIGTDKKNVDVLKNKEIDFNVTIDKETFSLKLPVANFFELTRTFTIVGFSNFLMSDLLIDKLKNGSEIVFEITGPEELKNKFGIPDETFSLDGFTAHYLKINEACRDSNEHNPSKEEQGNAEARLNPGMMGKNARNICSEEDIRASAHSEEINYAEATEYVSRAYSAGEEIQTAVLNRDIDALYSFIDGELINGPRKEFLQNKQFNDVFSDEWRQKILSDVPPCAPLGSQGFMLGSGHIWYRAASDGKPSIFSINGAVDEMSGSTQKKEWVYDGQVLKGSCFTTNWRSGDNYEHFHDTFANTVNQEEFDRYIGKYIGDKVPLGSIESPWSGMYGESDNIALAEKISECQQYNEKTKKNFDPTHVPTYEIIKKIPKSLCKTLAPNLPQGCEEVALVTVTQHTGGSMSVVDTVLYGIVKQPETLEAYLVPLVNFDHKNDALNFLEHI